MGEVKNSMLITRGKVEGGEAQQEEESYDVTWTPSFVSKDNW